MKRDELLALARMAREHRRGEPQALATLAEAVLRMDMIIQIFLKARAPLASNWIEAEKILWDAEMSAREFYEDIQPKGRTNHAPLP